MDSASSLSDISYQDEDDETSQTSQAFQAFQAFQASENVMASENFQQSCSCNSKLPLLKACNEAYIYLVVCIGALNEIELDLANAIVFDFKINESLRQYEKDCEALKLAKENLWILAEDLVDSNSVNMGALQNQTTGISDADICILRTYNNCCTMFVKRFNLLMHKSVNKQCECLRIAARQIYNLNFALLSNTL